MNKEQKWNTQKVATEYFNNKLTICRRARIRLNIDMYFSLQKFLRLKFMTHLLTRGLHYNTVIQINCLFIQDHR